MVGHGNRTCSPLGDELAGVPLAPELRPVGHGIHEIALRVSNEVLHREDVSPQGVPGMPRDDAYNERHATSNTHWQAGAYMCASMTVLCCEPS